MGSGKKKVLILTYYFPPGNFAGSYRIYSWAEHLHLNGYYPIVVTRHWKDSQSDYTAISDIPSPQVIKNDNCEVHYLPYNGNLRDRISKYGRKTFLLRKALSLVELVLQNFTNRVIPFRNIHDYALNLLSNDPEIKLVITSGRPHVLFRFGYLLNKKLGIPWIADYRDPWNTHTWYSKNTFLPLRLIEKRSEKKWVSTASALTTCSERWRDEITKFTGTEGFVVMNGYEEIDEYIGSGNADKFIITHNGSLYDMQEISVFVKALKRFIDDVHPSLMVHFPGLAIDDKQVKRIKREIKGYESFFSLEERLPKKEIVKRLGESHLLLLFGSHELKGWYPIKLFEYLIAQKNILLCPSDHDVLERVVQETQAGVSLNTEEEVCRYLKEKYREWVTKGKLSYSGNLKAIKQYSRKEQANKLASVMDGVRGVPLASPEIETAESKVVFTLLKCFKKAGADRMLYRYNKAANVTTLLCFHRVSDDVDYSYPPLKIKEFEKLIEYISGKYEVISLRQVHEKSSSSLPRMILTFDDGYKDFIENALPVLSKYKMPATLSVIVNCVNGGNKFWTLRLNSLLNFIYCHYRYFKLRGTDGETMTYRRDIDQPEKFSLVILKSLLSVESAARDRFMDELERRLPDYRYCEEEKFMNWKDLGVCVSNGMEIASHSVSHDSLVTIHDDTALRTEIAGSKSAIEAKIAREVSTFAFPNGVYDDKVVRFAQEGGYKFLLTTHEHYFKNNFRQKEDITILPRITISRNRFEENLFKMYNLRNPFKLRQIS